MRKATAQRAQCTCPRTHRKIHMEPDGHSNFSDSGAQDLTTTHFWKHTLHIHGVVLHVLRCVAFLEKDTSGKIHQKITISLSVDIGTWRSSGYSIAWQSAWAEFTQSNGALQERRSGAGLDFHPPCAVTSHCPQPMQGWHACCR